MGTSGAIRGPNGDDVMDGYLGRCTGRYWLALAVEHSSASAESMASRQVSRP